jgi:hypothetical protein
MNVAVPERETELRGPQLREAQGNRNAAFEGAIAAVTERSQQTAAADYAIALEQQRKAAIQEDAANYTQAERASEMEQRQADFDQSVKALSQQSYDPNRFWANASTEQKIASFVALLVGGLAQAKGAPVNAGAEEIKRMRDQDLRAQEFAYNASRDTVNAKQTAFAMAMQKWNNVDAARAAARAAANDTIAAQLAGQAALWKGTDAANRAQMAMAALQDDRAAQIAAGVAFTPAHTVAVGAQYVDPRTGLVYNEKEAHGVVEKIDEREAKAQEQGRNIAGQILVEREKSGAKADDKTDTGARFIAEKLQTAGVPQARTAAEQALKALNESEGGAAEAATRTIAPGAVANAVLSDKANAREQSYNAFKNAAMKAIAGNVTASEEARMDKQFGLATDPASRRRAIQASLEMLDNIEKGIKAGATPDVQQEYDRRRQAAEAVPAAPKGSKAGWK